jgi:hypothetical protein
MATETHTAGRIQYLPPRAPSERQSLREFVDKIASRCETPEGAETLAMEELLLKPDLADEAMRLGLRQMIGEMRTRLRTSMVKARRGEWRAEKNAPRGFAGAAAARASFYNWPLPNSAVVLGDATVADLEAAAAFHDVHRDAHASRGGAYRQIAALLTRATSNQDVPVRKIVAEGELARILAGTPA